MPMSGLDIRPPQQQRAIDSWSRVLDAGVALLERGGNQALTIQAVCELAGVTPPSIYARVQGKRALYLAVYRHGMEAVSTHAPRIRNLEFSSAPDMIEGAVRELADAFFSHQGFLRAAILQSSIYPEIATVGAGHSAEFARAFADAICKFDGDLVAGDRQADVDICFRMIFATLSQLITRGEAFGAASTLSREAIVAGLCRSAKRLLLAQQSGMDQRRALSTSRSRERLKTEGAVKTRR
jgi:AcrR family transcriptional regulator